MFYGGNPSMYDRLLDVFVNVAVFSTICLFLTGFEICWRIKKQNSSTGISSAPFHMGVISGSLWLQYGLLKGDSNITTVNIVSSFLYSLYIGYYWTKTSYPAKKTQTRIIIIEITFLLCVVFYVHKTYMDTKTILQCLGIMCMVFNIGTISAPLISLNEVIRSRSTESLPLPLCIANFLVTLQWLVYGILASDVFILIPNAIALFTSLCQILLFFLYPRRRKLSSSESVNENIEESFLLLS
uniref:Sugar transporter SWEET n=1 Tax=Syphacia muris TaxID=451379 RepID=A0A0N5AFT7_9BILA